MPVAEISQHEVSEEGISGGEKLADLSIEELPPVAATPKPTKPIVGIIYPPPEVRSKYDYK